MTVIMTMAIIAKGEEVEVEFINKKQPQRK